MSFLFLFLFIVFTFLRPQEWVPGMIGWTVIDVFAVLALVGLLFERMATKQKVFAAVPQNKLILLFFGSILMSHVAHTYFWGLRFSFFSFLPVLILFYLTLNGLDTEKKFKIIFWLIIIMNMILVKQGYDQFNNFYGWAGQPITIDRGPAGVVHRINWIGILGDPNDQALSFVVAFGFLLPFVIGKSGIMTRIFSCAGSGWLLYGVYLTNSRGGILAVLATIFFFFVRKTRKFLLGGIIGGVFGAGFLVFAPSRMSELSSSSGSGSSRLDLWYGGIQLFKQNPIFGRGYGMFMEQLPQVAHNSFVQAAAELGIVGLFLWIAILYSAIKGCWIVQDKCKAMESYAIALQSSIVGFSAAAFFLTRTYNILLFILIALSGSLMHVYWEKDSTVKYDLTKKDLRNILIISIFSLFAVYCFIRAR
ncbi:MAG: O-antigen ligase family protein [Candidatus Omnitrophica bacterium]|nr:O-antigen ligase family protein [Candidatus Omnitrophota bacterium]